MTLRSTFCCFPATVLLGILLSSLGFAQEEESAEAVALYNTAANLFGEKEFALAINQYDQILEKHPEFSRKRDTQYYKALAHYNLQQYPAAAESFVAVRDSLPQLKDYRRSDKLLLYLAFSQYQIAKASDEAEQVDALKSSLNTYEQFFSLFSESELAAQAWFYRGEAFYELSRLENGPALRKRAAEAYQCVINDYPASALRRRAQFAYGTCLEEMADFVAAEKVYEGYLEEFPEDEKADELRLRLADSLLQQGIAAKNTGDAEIAKTRFEQADKIYQRLIDTPRFTSIAAAMYQRAYCSLLTGQYKTAADLYATVANDYKDFEYADEAALDAGKYYFSAGDMTLAEKWLALVAEKDAQQRAEATHWLCRIQLEKGAHQTALELANKMLADDPGNFEVNLKMDAADALYHLPERKRDAVSMYLSIAEKYPQQSVAAKALYYAAFGYLSVGDYPKAIETAQAFRIAYPQSEFLADTLEVLGQAALKTKQLTLADETFQLLVTQFSDHPRQDWWSTRAGWIQYLQGDYDAAIGLLAPTVLKLKDTTSLSEAHYIMGASQYELKNYAKAIEAFETALQVNPDRSNNDAVRLLTARAWSNQGEQNKALEIANSVWQTSANLDAAYWLAEFAYRAKDYPTAEENFLRVIAADPALPVLPDALYGLAWTQSQTGETATAVQTFDRLLKEHPDHPLANDALIGRGRVRRMNGDNQGAVEDLDRYLATQPNSTNRFNATYERALCLVQLKKWESAITALESLSNDLSTNRSLADDVLFELAWAYQENAQAAKAVSTFQKIADDFTDSPHAAEANYHVGQDLYRQKQFDEAIVRYEKSLQGKHDDKVGELATYKLAWCFFKKEDYPKSLATFQRQTTDYPEGELKPVGLSMIAESHFQLEQHPQAATAFKVAIPAIEASNVTNNVRVLAPIHAAQSANQIKDHASAIEYANLVLSNHPESPFIADAWYEIGVAEKGMGNPEKSLQAFTSAMQNSLGKTGARARCMIGEAYFEDQKFDDAIMQFKLVINGYGGRDSAAAVKPWQAFAAYEAARCYYVQVSDTPDVAKRKDLITKARNLFQRLIDDYPNEPLATEARKQIQTLDQLK